MKAAHQTDVVFALTGDVRHNSRAQRQIRAMERVGLRIDVLSIGDDRDEPLADLTAQVHQFRRPSGSGSRYFWRIHQIFIKAAAAVPASVYHASDLYALPALAAAAAGNNGKLVYDARELYPHVSATVGRPWVRFFWKAVERRFIRRAHSVLTVSEGIADKLVSFYGIDRPTVVHNVPEPSDATTTASLRESADRMSSELLILHLGQMREHRGCELLVDAMRDVEGAILVFMGSGPLKPQLERQAADLRISSKVRFTDPVPPDQVLAYTASADIGVSLLDDVCLNHHYALPNKFFEYLTAGVPVVASDLPEMRRIVREFDVGMLVHPGDREDLVAGLNQAILDKQLREKWRRNIPDLVETFNWTRASQDFLHIYDDLLRDS